MFERGSSDEKLCQIAIEIISYLTSIQITRKHSAEPRVWSSAVAFQSRTTFKNRRWSNLHHTRRTWSYLQFTCKYLQQFGLLISPLKNFICRLHAKRMIPAIHGNEDLISQTPYFCLFPCDFVETFSSIFTKDV